MTDEIETIRSLILNNKKPSYQTTNHREVRVRCPYCGDSKHDPSSAHFYIAMKPPFMFHCFKCETSGVLNSQVLRDLGLFEQNLSLSIISANKNYKANTGTQKLSFKKINLNNPIIESPQSQNALNYFNNRFNLNYSLEDLTTKFKVIPDPLAFFNVNNINAQLNQFDYANAIGFISSDSSHLIFRDISGMSQKRYNNLALVNEENNTLASKIYNISAEIDFLQPSVDLIMTEGIFDIIGVYSHFYKNNSKNKIFAAACGKAYYAVILNYIRMGLLNLNITIYSDADVPVYFYKNMKQNSPYLKNSQITIYYNSLYNPETKFGKDFGVPKEQINLKKVII